jgi:hypothetical protein
MIKQIAILCFVLEAAVLGYWFSQGAHMTNRNEIPVEETKVDEFGDEQKITTWKKEFRLGLVDGALPISIALSVLGAVLLIKAKRDESR